MNPDYSQILGFLMKVISNYDELNSCEYPAFSVFKTFHAQNRPKVFPIMSPQVVRQTLESGPFMGLDRTLGKRLFQQNCELKRIARTCAQELRQQLHMSKEAINPYTF